MLRLGMRWLAQSAVLAAALALGGCASNEVGPTPAELKANWNAQNIVPQGYKSDLMAFLRTYLNDPSRIRDASVATPMLKFMGPGERYVVCVRYNERKSDGKYAGVKEGFATFVSGKLDRFFDVPKEVREMCKEAAYAPFPELQTMSR